MKRIATRPYMDTPYEDAHLPFLMLEFFRIDPAGQHFKQLLDTRPDDLHPDDLSFLWAGIWLCLKGWLHAKKHIQITSKRNLKHDTLYWN